jgi:hypothetical protein
MQGPWGCKFWINFSYFKWEYLYNFQWFFTY